MLKVLHCYKTYYPDTFGGIEQVIYQLSEGSLNHGIESTVFTLSRKAAILDDKIANHSIYRVKKDFEIASTPFSFSAISKFKKIANDADIIHYHFPYPFMDFMHFAANIKKPSVLTYHSDIVRQGNLLKIYSPLMYTFLDKVNAIVASSPNYVKTSCVLDKYKSKVSIIPFGLDPNFYKEQSKHSYDKWKKYFPAGFFLFVGAFRYYKGLQFLIDAAMNCSYPVVIVGTGPIEYELKEQARKKNIKNVFFVGAVNDEDKKALISLCTAVIFPSHLRSEAFGISLLEGALYSKPLISCEIGTGTTYINIDKQTGIVVKPGDSGGLRNAMDTIWYNPELAKNLGNGAFTRFNKLFTAERMVNDYVSLYRSILLKR
ncbi:glycosyltransferase [Kluyvera georgiana]|uniref:glycosyltransferase n=1 Tax=Kluyvera georgiana TaxID=73098 RepID=UPI00321FFFBD